VTDEELYWDPIGVLPEGEAEATFRGRWEDRLWLNVPGPFYTGESDTCWTGRLHAPRHVLYGGEYVSEYVYRQPTTRAQQTHLVQQHQSGEHTFADLAELFSVSRATVYRVLERNQNAPAPSTSGGQ
jgi:hypothetical protein